MVQIFEIARLLTEEFAEHIEYTEPDCMNVFMKDREDLMTVVAGLRVKRLGYLACITGLDPGLDLDYLEVLYHFCPNGIVINLRVKIPKSDPRISSLCSIVPNAEPYERELCEMLGITVDGLRNQDRLYLPEDWQEGVYPLRKDFKPQSIIHQN